MFGVWMAFQDTSYFWNDKPGQSVLIHSQMARCSFYGEQLPWSLEEHGWYGSRTSNRLGRIVAWFCALRLRRLREPRAVPRQDETTGVTWGLSRETYYLRWLSVNHNLVVSCEFERHGLREFDEKWGTSTPKVEMLMLRMMWATRVWGTLEPYFGNMFFLVHAPLGMFFIRVHTYINIHRHICAYIHYVYVCVYIYIYLYVYIYTYSYTHVYIFIYIYWHTGNAWALPRRCSVEGPHSQSNVVATLHSIGKINKGIREIKIPPPLRFTFNWEDQQRY